MDRPPKIYNIFREVAVKFVLKLRIFRLLLLPSLAIVLFSTYLEVHKSTVMKNLTNSLIMTQNTTSYQTNTTENTTNLTDNLTFNTVFYENFLLFLLVSFVAVLLNKLNTLIFAYPCQYVYKNCMVDGMQKYLKMGYAQFTRDPTGKIHSILERRSESTGELVTIFFTRFIQIPAILAYNFYSLARGFDTIIVGIVCAQIVLYVSISVLLANWRSRIKLELNKKYNSANDLQLELLKNYEIVQTYDSLDFECDRYEKKCRKTMRPGSKIRIVFYFADLLLNFILLIMDSLIIYLMFLGFGVKYTIGHFSEYILKSRLLKTKLAELSGIYGMSIIHYANLYEYHCIPEATTPLLHKTFVFNEKVELKDVSVSLNNNLVLTNINFEIKRGDKVAIIGNNGSGKTTLIKTLLGLYDYEGSICVDNQELSSISKKSLRRNVSFVPQDQNLMNETVIQNIRYGNKINDPQIYDVCKRYQVFESFANLEEGFYTRIGENGKSISGGERQKISLMRALVKDCDTLMLDEPTSSIDSVSEKIIFDTLCQEKDKTVVCVTHKPTLLKNFNKVVLIENGECKYFADLQKYDEFINSGK